jgi:hypothetical protein
MTEAVRTSDTSVNINLITLRYIPEELVDVRTCNLAAHATHFGKINNI